MDLGPTQPPIQWVSGDLSLGLKRPWREADHSPPSSTKVKEWVELYLHSPNTSSWRGAQLKKYRDKFIFYLYLFYPNRSEGDHEWWIGKNPEGGVVEYFKVSSRILLERESENPAKIQTVSPEFKYSCLSLCSPHGSCVSEIVLIASNTKVTETVFNSAWQITIKHILYTNYIWRIQYSHGFHFMTWSLNKIFTLHTNFRFCERIGVTYTSFILWTAAAWCSIVIITTQLLETNNILLFLSYNTF
jgi:hypothetical protein